MGQFKAPMGQFGAHRGRYKTNIWSIRAHETIGCCKVEQATECRVMEQAMGCSVEKTTLVIAGETVGSEVCLVPQLRVRGGVECVPWEFWRLKWCRHRRRS